MIEGQPKTNFQRLQDGSAARAANIEAYRQAEIARRPIAPFVSEPATSIIQEGSYSKTQRYARVAGAALAVGSIGLLISVAFDSNRNVYAEGDKATPTPDTTTIPHETPIPTETPVVTSTPDRPTPTVNPTDIPHTNPSTETPVPTSTPDRITPTVNPTDIPHKTPTTTSTPETPTATATKPKSTETPTVTSTKPKGSPTTTATKPATATQTPTATPEIPVVFKLPTAGSGGLLGLSTKDGARIGIVTSLAIAAIGIGSFLSGFGIGRKVPEVPKANKRLGRKFLKDL